MSGPFKLKSGNTTPFKQMGSSPLKGKWYTAKPGYTSSDFGRTWKKKGALTTKQKIMETLAARKPKFTHSISKVGPKAKKLVKKYKGGFMKGVQGAGGKALGVASFFLGSMSAATADQPIDPKTGVHRKTGEQAYKPFKK